ncbi:MAG: TolB-like 6-bladed beta-propeller domain-containing protein [Bacteroidales bacterium]|nr:TolB-like 6-bladed beta-propeller domain-containing protein [Bacteroidales bacterium]
MDCDSSFIPDFPQTLNCVGVSIVNDSILLLREQKRESNDLHLYKAYSLPDFSYLGEYFMYGRGPGEYLSPDLGGICNLRDMDNRCEYVFDIMQNKSYAFDFVKSTETGRDISYPISELPDETLYAYPFCDTLQFIMNMADKSLHAHISNQDGSNVQTTKMYPGLVSMNNYSQFSNAVAINNERGIIALMMTYLPQLNILNPMTGDIKSFAVDKAYKDWKRIINISSLKAIMNTSMYYTCANSASSHIIAVYRNVSPGNLKDSNKGSHIHIFDWDGEFLYDIELNEMLGATAFDPQRKHLYTNDALTDEIYRYDLSGLI